MKYNNDEQRIVRKVDDQRNPNQNKKTLVNKREGEYR